MLRLARLTALITLLGLAGQPAVGWAGESATSRTPRRLELIVYTLDAQLAGSFTQQAGFGLAASYRLSDRLAVQVHLAHDGYLADDSAFQNEMEEKALLRSQAARSLLTPTRGILKMEMTALQGSLVFAHWPFSLEVFLSAGAGIVSTALPIPGRPEDPYGGAEPPFVGRADAGLRAAGTMGFGARLRASERWGLRLEIHSLIFRHTIDELSHCSTTGWYGEPCGITFTHRSDYRLQLALQENPYDGFREPITRMSGSVGIFALF